MALDINPWLQIWVKPKQTIRAIINHNPMYHFYALSAIYGFPLSLHLAQNFSLIDTLSFPVILVLTLLLSVIVGMIGITVSAALTYWTGRWIGGRSTYSEMRAVAAWSNVPNVVNIVLWLILIAVFQDKIFSNLFPKMAFSGFEHAVMSGAFFLQLIVSVWSFVMLVNMVAEAQRFSIWKAILNVIMPFILVILAIWIGVSFVQMVS